MREYVIVLPKKDSRSWRPNDILLILKDKPLFLKGRLNLVGGKIEPGETPIEAAKRELKEESGFVGFGMDICGKMVGKAKDTIDGEDWVIWCCRCDIHGDMPTPEPSEGETEKVEWYSSFSALNDKRLMPNLKLIIPLLMMDVKGWTITDQTKELEFPYQITLEFSE